MGKNNEGGGTVTNLRQLSPDAAEELRQKRIDSVIKVVLTQLENRPIEEQELVEGFKNKAFGGEISDKFFEDMVLGLEIPEDANITTVLTQFAAVKRFKEIRDARKKIQTGRD